MAEAIKTRIQLKNDTEENCNKATNFIPKTGELIIYSTDEAHPFPRFKVGDGTTKVINLPFAGLVQSYGSYSNFPQMGNIGNLYIDESQSAIYYFSITGYKLLTIQHDATVQKLSSKVVSWNAGVMTTSSVNNNGTLVIQNGTAPSLNLNGVTVVTSIDPT